MHEAPRRQGPREGPTKPPTNHHRTPGRIGRRRTKAMIATRRKPPRWPASGNAVRLETMKRQERIAQITRELLQHDDIKRNDHLKALAFEAQALAEISRRELGEAKPG
jgi:hypothetical protein